MTALLWIVLTIRFLDELALLAALCWVGTAPSSLLASCVLALALPLLAAAIWGAWIAPRAGARLPDPPRLLLEIVLFGATAAGLAAIGHPKLAIAFLTISVAVALASRALGGEDVARPARGPAAGRRDSSAEHGPEQGSS